MFVNPQRAERYVVVEEERRFGHPRCLVWDDRPVVWLGALVVGTPS